jgi:hypothetical protein
MSRKIRWQMRVSGLLQPMECQAENPREISAKCAIKRVRFDVKLSLIGRVFDDSI